MNPHDVQALKKRIIVTYSPGGGNGKSEIAANLAYCMARRGRRVWILDANTFAPAQDIIFELNTYGQTFSDYLVDDTLDELPVYDVSGLLGVNRAGALFVTPSTRDDCDVRYDLQERTNENQLLIHDLPAALFDGMAARSIDLLIVDTYPSFEAINEVWLGLTEFLLLVSRIHTVDLENLRALLQDETVNEIDHKLIVFNNVHLDGEGRPAPDIDEKKIEWLLRTKQRLDLKAYLASCTVATDAGCRSHVGIFRHPILYSENLALFRQMAPRNGLFVQRDTTDQFSRTVDRLADYILKMYPHAPAK